jgi:hypothetical protein
LDGADLNGFHRTQHIKRTRERPARLARIASTLFDLSEDDQIFCVILK